MIEEIWLVVWEDVFWIPENQGGKAVLRDVDLVYGFDHHFGDATASISRREEKS